jgi:hypothetical protein
MDEHAASSAQYLQRIVNAPPYPQNNTTLGRLASIRTRLGDPQFDANNNPNWDHYDAVLSNAITPRLSAGLLHGLSVTSLDALHTHVSHTSTAAYTPPAETDPFSLLRAITSSDALVTALQTSPEVYKQIQMLWAQNMTLAADASWMHTVFNAQSSESNAKHEAAIDQLNAQQTADLTNTINTHEAVQQRLQSTIAEIAATGGKSKTSSLEFEHPEKFDGNASKLPEWVIEVTQKITHNDEFFPTEVSKVAYTLSRLTGDAKTSVAHAYDKNGALRINPDTQELDAFPHLISIFDHCRTAFGDTDEAFTAESNIMKMKMGDGIKNTFPALITKFLHVAAHLTWDDNALAAHLHQALHPLLQQTTTDKLPVTGRPAKLTDYVNFIRLEDAKLRRNSQYATYNTLHKIFGKVSASAAPHFNSTPSLPPVVDLPTANPDAMDMSAARLQLINGHLPPGAAAARRRLGRCGFCNEKHAESDCPGIRKKEAEKTAVKLAEVSKN